MGCGSKQHSAWWPRAQVLTGAACSCLPSSIERSQLFRVVNSCFSEPQTMARSEVPNCEPHACVGISGSALEEPEMVH